MMGLRIVSDEWVAEMERENECNLKALKSMTKAHDNAIKSYRELRDSKNEEIANLHTEIEALKQDKLKLQQEVTRLKKAVHYYEAHRVEVRDGKNAV